MNIAAHTFLPYDIQDVYKVASNQVILNFLTGKQHSAEILMAFDSDFFLKKV